MIDGRNFFNQPIKNDIKKYENIRKITTCQGDDYTTGSHPALRCCGEFAVTSLCTSQ